VGPVAGQNEILDLKLGRLKHVRIVVTPVCRLKCSNVLCVFGKSQVLLG